MKKKLTIILITALSLSLGITTKAMQKQQNNFLNLNNKVNLSQNPYDINVNNILEKRRYIDQTTKNFINAVEIVKNNTKSKADMSNFDAAKNEFLKMYEQINKEYREKERIVDILAKDLEQYNKNNLLPTYETVNTIGVTHRVTYYSPHYYKKLSLRGRLKYANALQKLYLTLIDAYYLVYELQPLHWHAKDVEIALSTIRENEGLSKTLDENISKSIRSLFTQFARFAGFTNKITYARLEDEKNEEINRNLPYDTNIKEEEIEEEEKEEMEEEEEEKEEEIEMEEMAKNNFEYTDDNVDITDLLNIYCNPLDKLDQDQHNRNLNEINDSYFFVNDGKQKFDPNRRNNIKTLQDLCEKNYSNINKEIEKYSKFKNLDNYNYNHIPLYSYNPISRIFLILNSVIKHQNFKISEFNKYCEKQKLKHNEQINSNNEIQELSNNSINGFFKYFDQHSNQNDYNKANKSEVNRYIKLMGSVIKEKGKIAELRDKYNRNLRLKNFKALNAQNMKSSKLKLIDVLNELNTIQKDILYTFEITDKVYKIEKFSLLNPEKVYINNGMLWNYHTLKKDLITLVNSYISFDRTLETGLTIFKKILEFPLSELANDHIKTYNAEYFTKLCKNENEISNAITNFINNNKTDIERLNNLFDFEVTFENDKKHHNYLTFVLTILRTLSNMSKYKLLNFEYHLDGAKLNKPDKNKNNEDTEKMKKALCEEYNTVTTRLANFRNCEEILHNVFGQKVTPYPISVKDMDKVQTEGNGYSKLSSMTASHKASYASRLDKDKKTKEKKQNKQNNTNIFVVRDKNNVIKRNKNKNTIEEIKNLRDMFKQKQFVQVNCNIYNKPTNVNSSNNEIMKNNNSGNQIFNNIDINDITFKNNNLGYQNFKDIKIDDSNVENNNSGNQDLYNVEIINSNIENNNSGNQTITNISMRGNKSKLSSAQNQTLIPLPEENIIDLEENNANESNGGSTKNNNTKSNNNETIFMIKKRKK